MKANSMKDYKGTFDYFLGKELLCINQLANRLNNGNLSLLLGSGASKALNLPDWSELVKRCVNNLSIDFDIDDKTTIDQLKEAASLVKEKCQEDKTDYRSKVTDQLYEGIKLDFRTANKELLIAITSLIVGRRRGTVDWVMTYNFDSILEWYIGVNGLSANVLSSDNILVSQTDLTVFHVHGYLPHTKMKNQSRSKEIVFTKEEFDDRKISKNDYWKEVMYQTFRERVFLSVGASPSTLIDDICPYLRSLDDELEQNSINRGTPNIVPYGFAIIPPDECDDKIESTLLRHGIIVIKIEIKEIPDFIFSISQDAANKP